MASNTIDTKDLQNLTRKQLLELERKKKSKVQLWLDMIIWLLPFLGGAVAILEYTQLPDNSRNANPGVYLTFLWILRAAYAIYCVISIVVLQKGNRDMIDKLDLNALAEFKRGSNGVVEVKFTDRMGIITALMERCQEDPTEALLRQLGGMADE